MSSKLLIGWSAKDVTPKKPASLWGQFHIRIADSVKDPITVTALAMSTEGGKDEESSFIWISCDIVAIPDSVLEMSRNKLRKMVKDFPVKNLVLNAIHTHTAPALSGTWHASVPKGVMTSEEFAEFLTDRIAEAAAESWKNRKHGFIAYGMGYAQIAHGRRAFYKDDLSKRKGYKEGPGFSIQTNAQMYGNTGDDKFDGIEGYCDNSTHFLFTFDSKRKLTGAIINIACPSQETEHLHEISADFWNETRVALKKEYGKKLFLLPQVSAAGDLSPHLMFNKKATERMLKLKGHSSRQEIANRIKAAFDEVYSWASKDMKETAVVKHSSATIELPRRMVTEKEYLKIKKGLLELENIPPSKATAKDKRMEEDSVISSRKVRCLRIIERYEEQKKDQKRKMELHVIRVGDIAFATNPFELFSAFGIRIQARSPALQTFVVQLCGHDGYLPTKTAEDGGSYSACVYCNEVGSKGGDALVEKTLEKIKELWK